MHFQHDQSQQDRESGTGGDWNTSRLCVKEVLLPTILLCMCFYIVARSVQAMKYLSISDDPSDLYLNVWKVELVGQNPKLCQHWGPVDSVAAALPCGIDLPLLYERNYSQNVHKSDDCVCQCMQKGQVYSVGTPEGTLLTYNVYNHVCVVLCELGNNC